jgi:hypothetical protein
MKKFNLLLILFNIFILISIFQVSAFNSYLNWGNGEKQLTGCNNWFFSSCYPQNDLSLNFSKYSISVSQVTKPIIAKHQNDLSLYYNDYFLYSFSNTLMTSYYTNNFAVYNTNVLKGKLLFSPQFIRDDSIFHGYLLMYMYNSSNTARMSICDADVNGNICKNVNIDYEVESNANAFYDLEIEELTGNYAYLLSDGSIIVKDYNGNLLNQVSTGVTPLVKANHNITSNDKFLTLGTFFTTGKQLVFALHNFYSDANKPRVTLTYGVLDVTNNAWLLNPTTSIVSSSNNAMVQGSTTFSSLRVNVVTLGSQNSQPLIYFNFNFNPYIDGQGRFTRNNNYLYSSNGVQLYKDDIGYYEIASNYYNSNLVFADINFDGYNEMCEIARGYGLAYNDNRYFFQCIDNTYNLVLNFSYSSYTGLSMGKYASDPYLQVLLYDGIYNINSTSNGLTKIYNLTSLTSSSELYPISLYTKLNYSNDLLVFSNSNIIGYKLSSPSSTCGDNVCSSLETPLICPVDCPIEQANATSNIKITGEYCTDNSQCISNSCSFNKCVLLGFSEACTFSSQCLSGSCLNSVCTDPGSSAVLKQTANNIFGFSDSDGIFFYLLVAGVILIIGFIVCVNVSSVVPIVMAMVFDVIILVAFTFMLIIPGWFLLVTMILLMLIAFIIFMIFSPQG